jgi:heptosyltransferase-2
MKILVVQNRMGIGDTVIFLPFVRAISEKFNTPVSLLVKESSKADQYLNNINYLDKIIFLERNYKRNERHNGILGSIRLAQDLKKYEFNKIFIFNSSLRFNIVARLANIKKNLSVPSF